MLKAILTAMAGATTSKTSWAGAGTGVIAAIGTANGWDASTVAGLEGVWAAACIVIGAVVKAIEAAKAQPVAPVSGEEA